jgi:signal transduction histidine kinase
MTQSAAALILIVDDEPQNRKLLETLLRPEGYVTRSAANGEDALASITQQPPDLILLDIMMPGMDGYQVASTLKADPMTSKIPIIMVTAQVDRSARLVALSSGAEDFLAKPVDRGELWLRVRNLLRLKALGDLESQSSQLQEQVQARADGIVHLNVELEERVQDRTAQLHAANKELAAFSYSLSHDLRASLSAVDGFSELLGKEIQPATDRGKHYLGRIRAGVASMNQLIDAMLQLAHASQATPRRVPVDLSAIAEAALGALREREPCRVVHWDVEPGLIVQGDPNLLSQVLENLLGNAWKFSSRKPRTKISFKREYGADGKAVYAVRDEGAGFDMASSDKLFTAFQRLHSKSEFPGTGIGLATVQTIVMHHGGKVWADSQEGRGANFYFTLDAAAQGLGSATSAPG